VRNKKADVVNPALFLRGGDAARPNSGERETFDRVKNRSSSPPVSSRPLSSWWSAAPIPVASFDQAGRALFTNRNSEGKWFFLLMRCRRPYRHIWASKTWKP
jgi:hypothetical protein